MFNSFKDMPVWQKAMNVAENIFNLTNNLPKKEDYGFTSQIRRSALSIAANIAEAYGRHHISDKIKFYYYSRGSITETQSHLEYARRVGYIKETEMIKLNESLLKTYNDVNKIIVTLKNSNKN